MAREVNLILDLDTGRLRSAARRGERSVDKLDDSLDRTKRSTSALEGAWKKFGGVVGALAIGETIRRGFTRAINKGKEFEQQLADLEAITGITGGALEQLGNDALAASGEYGTAASNIVEAQKLVASQLAERIDFGTQQGIEELKEISRQATILQRAAGIDLRTAVQATTQTINQFNLEAADSSRVINVLAAGAKLGAAEVDAQAQALTNAGTAAAGAGISIEQTQAAVQRLAAAGVRGERAGTGLRNIFVRLQTRSEELAELGFSDVNIQADGLIGTLEKLAPLADDAVARTKLFGEEAQQFAQILLQDVDALAEFTEGVTGTDTAIEQADTQLNTFQGTLDRFVTALDEELITAFTDSQGALQQFVELGIDGVGLLADAIDTLNSRATRTFRIFNNFSTGTALDEQFRNNLSTIPWLGGKIPTGPITKFLNAQEESTRQFKAQVDAITQTNEAYADQRDEIEEGSAAYDLLNSNIERNVTLLEGDQTTLERTRTALLSAREGVEEGSDAYGRLTIRLQEVEKMLDRVNTALERNRQLSVGTSGGGTSGGGGGTSSGGGGGEKKDPIRSNFMQGDEVGGSTQSITGQILTDEEQILDALQKQNEERREAGDLSAHIQDNTGKEATAMQEVAAASIEAASASLARGESVVNAARAAIRAALAEAVAKQVRQVVSTVPFPLNIAIVGAAVASTKALFNQVVPEFQQGGFTGRNDQGQGGTLDGGRRIISVNEDGRSEFIVNADSTSAAPRLVSSINDSPQTAGALETAFFGDQGGGSVPQSGQGGGAGQGVGEIIQALERANVTARVQISDLDEKLTDFQELQRTIGN